MDEYWNSVNVNSVDPQLMAYNAHYNNLLKTDPNLLSQNMQQVNMLRYQQPQQVMLSNVDSYYPQQLQNNFTTISDSLEERIRNSLADIDEERVLNCLSSPEPELDQLLFPPDLQTQNNVVHNQQSHNQQQQLLVNQHQQLLMQQQIQAMNQMNNQIMANNIQSSPNISVRTPLPSPAFNQIEQKIPQRAAINNNVSNASTNSCDLANALEVTLFHKPRGCKGVWQKVAANDALRVTKGKGKWLKLEVKSRYEIKSGEVDVFLVESNGANGQLAHTDDEGITIESRGDSVTNGFCIVELELKLDRVCKKLALWCVAKTNFATLKGKSIEFSAHNNGKANNKNVKVEEPESLSESSSSSGSSSREAQITVIKKRRRNDNTHEEELPSSVVPGSLKVNGVVRAKAFLQYSDLRLKANVSDLVDAVNIVSQLKGRTYTWRTDDVAPTGGRRVIGLIAQEVRRVIPEVVYENENGLLSVSYAELVPVLIEALKEHINKYETDQDDVRNQLRILDTKLEQIATAVEREAHVQIIQQEQINHLQQTQQLQQQTIAQLPSVPIMPAPFKGLIFMDKPSELEAPKENIYKKNLLRTGVVVTFILGIMTIMLGAILLGMTLSSPSQSISTTIVEARDLKPMDRNGVPDPYVEITIGTQLFKSSTIWNSNHPIWDETFEAPLDESLTEIVFQVYDDDSNPYFPPRRMGYATLALDQVSRDKTYSEWLPLLPDTEGETVSGEILVNVYMSKPHKPAFELLLLFAGIFLTSVSLGLAFYMWRAGKNQSALEAKNVQMTNVVKV